MQAVGAIVGVADHGGWAIFVTVSRKGLFLDRRRVELVDDGLPKIPYHSEAQGLPLGEAIELVERVRESAEHHAKLRLDELASTITEQISGIALRQCPALPPTIAERLNDYYARNNADWVMYRQALAEAASARGWNVHWYESKKLNDAPFADLKNVLGPPWNKDYRVAMAAAIDALAP